MNDLAFAAWLGGAACYAGVLLAGKRRGSLLGVVGYALVWPICICVVLATGDRGHA